ncbi:MAG: two-component regulator propeller domain-containing protein [Bacteroidota bacterium]
MNIRLLLICICVYTGSVYAGDPGQPKYLGIEHGLSNNAVTCIYQDHNGFMWFGTYDGLNRYDGYSFKIFRNVIGDSASLNDNHIYTIEADAGHRLWIGGAKGISIYNPARSDFSSPLYRAWNTHIVQPIKEGVGVVKSINQGSFILAGTQNIGLVVFEKNNAPGIQIPLYDFKGREVTYNVTAVQPDPSQKIAWVFVRQAGFVYTIWQQKH